MGPSLSGPRLWGVFSEKPLSSLWLAWTSGVRAVPGGLGGVRDITPLCNLTCGNSEKLEKE